MRQKVILVIIGSILPLCSQQLYGQTDGMGRFIDAGRQRTLYQQPQFRQTVRQSSAGQSGLSVTEYLKSKYFGMVVTYTDARGKRMGEGLVEEMSIRKDGYHFKIRSNSGREMKLVAVFETLSDKTVDPQKQIRRTASSGRPFTRENTMDNVQHQQQLNQMLVPLMGGGSFGAGTGSNPLSSLSGINTPNNPGLQNSGPAELITYYDLNGKTARDGLVAITTDGHPVLTATGARLTIRLERR